MHRPRRLDSSGATRAALRTLARRYQELDREVAELDAMLARLVAQAAPRLLKQPGVGPEIAARMLLIAGDNPTRLRNDSALAALCGASPIEASSGKTARHRLNRGGDRQGNSALWLIANNRMLHPETRDYLKRRTTEGKSTKERGLLKLHGENACAEVPTRAPGQTSPGTCHLCQGRLLSVGDVGDEEGVDAARDVAHEAASDE